MNERSRASENDVEELCNNEIVCVVCGSIAFRLTRDMPKQILLECVECGHPYLLEAVEFEDRPVIAFLTPVKV